MVEKWSEKKQRFPVWGTLHIVKTHQGSYSGSWKAIYRRDFIRLNNRNRYREKGSWSYKYDEGKTGHGKMENGSMPPMWTRMVNQTWTSKIMPSMQIVLVGCAGTYSTSKAQERITNRRAYDGKSVDGEKSMMNDQRFAEWGIWNMIACKSVSILCLILINLPLRENAIDFRLNMGDMEIQNFQW